MRVKLKIINVKVIPNAKKDKIVQQGEILKVYLTASPVDDKANKALVKVLSDYFKVKKKHIRIKKGEKIRQKLIEISS